MAFEFLKCFAFHDLIPPTYSGSCVAVPDFRHRKSGFPTLSHHLWHIPYPWTTVYNTKPVILYGTTSVWSTVRIGGDYVSSEGQMSALCIWPTVVAKGFENDTNTNFHKVCYFSVFRYFCHMLLWKTEVYYNNLISVKGFYWQFHEEDAKSQYLQCWPFFFKTSAIRPGMLSIYFWATS